MIAAGKSNAEIAEALVISPGTVARHVTNILNKTGCKNRTEAAPYAAEQGLTAGANPHPSDPSALPVLRLS